MSDKAEPETPEQVEEIVNRLVFRIKGQSSDVCADLLRPYVERAEYRNPTKSRKWIGIPVDQHLPVTLAALLREYGPKWQPIESAPKDGTWLMLWGEGWDMPTVGQRARYEPNAWQDMDHRLYRVTHWQSLPEPPDAK